MAEDNKKLDLERARHWKALRARMGGSQACLAARIGLRAPSAVHAWEAGEKEPARETGEKAAVALGISLEEFYGGPAHVPPPPGLGRKRRQRPHSPPEEGGTDAVPTADDDAMTRVMSDIAEGKMDPNSVAAALLLSTLWRDRRDMRDMGIREREAAAREHEAAARKHEAAAREHDARARAADAEARKIREASLSSVIAPTRGVARPPLPPADQGGADAPLRLPLRPGAPNGAVDQTGTDPDG